MTNTNDIFFKKLEHSDESLFLKKYIDDNPYADTSHATLLYWWCLEEDAEVAEINDNLCIRSTYPSGDGTMAYSLFGDNKVDKTLEKIFMHQKENGLPCGVHFVPSYTVNSIQDTTQFRIEDNRDIAEYVMSIKEHATLEGPNFKRLRNKVSHFNKLSFIPKIDFSVYTVDASNVSATRLNIRSINAAQKNDREKIEDQAIDKLLELHDHVKISCYVMKNGTEVIAMGLLKQLSPNTLNFCHLRYSSGYLDLFTYFFNAACKHILETSPQYEYVNIEQDLGIEGMRVHKLRMRPVFLLQKFSIYPSDSTL